MGPESQSQIKAVADRFGADNLVVVLGAADAEALEVAGETVTTGDPAFVGPLAGVSLGLPVVHILEPEVKQQVDPEVYSEQVGLLELTLDTEVVHEAMLESSPSRLSSSRPGPIAPSCTCGGVSATSSPPTPAKNWFM